MRILNAQTVRDTMDLTELIQVLDEALIKQGRNRVELPVQPNFDIGIGLQKERPDEPLGNVLVQPGYIHESAYFVTKVSSVNPGNRVENLPTVHSEILIGKASTGIPVGLLDATPLMNAKTGCVGAIAVRELATEPIRLGIIGAGTQARWQARMIAITADIEEIFVYSPSQSKYGCADDLLAELGVETTALDTADDVVRRANAIVTATTSSEPVFSANALTPGTVFIGIGSYKPDMQEIPAAAFDQAAAVFADAPENVAEVGDIKESNLALDDLIPLSTLLTDPGAHSDDSILGVKSAGSAVLDAAGATYVFERSAELDTGITVDW